MTIQTSQVIRVIRLNSCNSFMKYKDLFYFTGHCLALDEHPEFREKIIELFATEESNLEGFVQLCSDHLVIPAIYLKLKAHGLLALIPEVVEQVFAEIYELNRERNLQILRQIDDITATLSKENIQPVFLKGTANLLDGLYSDVGERMIGDIDFLVKEEDYLKAGTLLESKGYKHHEPTTYVDYTSRKHYPGLTKEEEPCRIEIHRILVSEPYSEDLKPELIFADRKSIPGKPGLFVPSDMHLLQHTFLHDQFEDKGHAFLDASFRGLYDLLQLSKRMNVSALSTITKYNTEAINWLVLGQRFFQLPGRFYPVETRSAKWFCLKYDASMKYVKIHQVEIILRKFFHLVFVRYMGGFLKAIFLKDERQFLIRRLKNPAWYSAHCEHLKDYIS